MKLNLENYNEHIIKKHSEIKPSPKREEECNFFACKKEERISQNDLEVKDIQNAKPETEKNLKTIAEKIDEKDKLIEEDKQAKKKRKNKIFSWITFLINILVLAAILTYSLVKEDAHSVLIPNIEWKYVAVVIVVVCAVALLDSLKHYSIIYATTKKSRPFLSYKVMALGRYYDAVTPLSTGGEPFQIYYMNKRGVQGDKATSVPLMEYIVWQIVTTIANIVVLIYSQVNNVGQSNPVVMLMAWISMTISAVILLATVMLSLSKKIAPRIVIGGLKLLSKMHIVKDYKKSFRNVLKFVINYQKTFKNLMKNFFVMILQFVLAILTYFLQTLLPYFIYKAFMPAGELLWYEVFIQSMICNMSLLLVPTPGGAGGAEGLFAIVFGSAFGDKIFWPVLFWRIATYYSNLLRGFIVLLYDFIIGNKRAEKLKASGSDMYYQNTKNHSFRQMLKQNIQTIETIQVQEEDKIPSQALVPSNDYEVKESEDIIKNSELVSEEEMEEKILPAESVLTEVRMKDISKKRKKRAKIYIKQEKKEQKNIKKEKKHNKKKSQ